MKRGMKLADESTTVTVRVSKETQDKFNQLAEGCGFKNKGDFVSYLLTQYQLEQTKAAAPILEPAIAAVSELSSRISRVLIGAGEQIAANAKKQQDDLAQSQASAGLEKAALQERADGQDLTIRGLQDEIRQLAKQNESEGQKYAELKRQLAQAQRAGNDKLALLDEYKEKIGRLTSLVAEQQGDAREAAKHAEQNRTLMFQLSTLQQQAEQQASRFELEKQQALLGLRQEMNGKMEEQQNKYAARLDEYEDKVRGLLLQLELRPPAPKARAAKDRPAGAGLEG